MYHWKSRSVKRKWRKLDFCDSQTLNLQYINHRAIRYCPAVATCIQGIFHYRGIRLNNVHIVYWYCWAVNNFLWLITQCQSLRIKTLCGHSSHKGLLVDGRGVFGVNQSHKCLILHLPAPIGDYSHSKTQSDLVQWRLSGIKIVN